MSEYFPIKTSTACKSKWAWSTIWFYDGTTASCHRCDRHPIDVNDFDNFNNTAPKIEQRQAMLKGEWPSTGGCDYCQKIEEAGGYSDRQFQTSIPGHTPPELLLDATATHVTPTIMEIFLSNTCNLSCIYCRPANSSKIEHEVNKFGPYRVGDVFERHNYPGALTRVPHEQELKAKFWDWMDRNSNALRRFHILGGEPMYMQDFTQCLEFWWDHPNPLVEINVVTNLMVNEKQFKKYIDYAKSLYDNGKIKRLDISASIECWGPEQEYTRMGLDLNVFEKNMEYLLAQDESWLRINVNGTISALSIKSMPAFIEKVKGWKARRTEFGQYSSKVVEPRILAPTIFPKGFFKEDFATILAAMPNTTWDEQQAYKMMEGMALQIENESLEEGRPDMIRQMIEYLNEIDERRGTNWKAVFPWLVAYSL